ncbi:hypothetical protein DW095_14395 [Bacteroides sp. AM07-16]|nr:hypothetical protein DW095_14395 [Bacteroides sp. AM07-16]
MKESSLCLCRLSIPAFRSCRLFQPSFRFAFTGHLFVLPAAGYRNNSSGSSNNQAAEGNYWSSTLESSGKSPRLNFNSSTANTDANNLANGFSVRCVQAFTKYSFKIKIEQR